jgi:DNA-binding GntR family transcriptional regulator
MPKKIGLKPTKTEKAYNVLKEGILQGKIAEGEFLSEAEIMSCYGLGRTPYREACNRLIHEGLLEAVPRRGYLVPEVPFHTVCEVFEVRIILEGAIAQLAAIRAKDSEIDDLEKLANEPVPSKNSKTDFAGIIQSNTAFHLRLAAMARNRKLLELLTRNLEETERFMYLELRSSRFHESEAQSLHAKIAEALRSRDPRPVREAVLRDIHDAQTLTLKFGTELLGPGIAAEANVAGKGTRRASLV